MLNIKKYELLENDFLNIGGIKLYRIKALIDFENSIMDVKKGDLGGYIESEENLSQEGNCWIDCDAIVCAKARVIENAIVTGDYHLSRPFTIKGSSCLDSWDKICDCGRIHKA